MEEEVSVSRADRSAVNSSSSDSFTSSSGSSSSNGSSSDSSSTSSSTPDAPVKSSVVLHYSDVSEDDLPPPAPAVPHPSVVASMMEPQKPAIETVFRTSGPVPARLLNTLSALNRRKREVLLLELGERIRVCSSRDEFLSLLEKLISGITDIIRGSRKAADTFSSDRDRATVNKQRFAVYKRADVWRKAIQLVSKTVKAEQSWSEEIRCKYWKRLREANRSSFYCCNLIETFPSEEIVS